MRCELLVEKEDRENVRLTTMGGDGGESSSSCENSLRGVISSRQLFHDLLVSFLLSGGGKDISTFLLVGVFTSEDIEIMSLFVKHRWRRKTT